MQIVILRREKSKIDNTELYHIADVLYHFIKMLLASRIRLIKGKAALSTYIIKKCLVHFYIWAV